MTDTLIELLEKHGLSELSEVDPHKIVSFDALYNGLRATVDIFDYRSRARPNRRCRFYVVATIDGRPLPSNPAAGLEEAIRSVHWPERGKTRR